MVNARWELDVRELGERVKSLHGEAVYGFTLRCAFAIATRNAVESPSAPTNEAVLSALRTEFLKLVRPH